MDRNREIQNISRQTIFGFSQENMLKILMAGWVINNMILLLNAKEEIRSRKSLRKFQPTQVGPPLLKLFR
jgi:hypothetical protein